MADEKINEHAPRLMKQIRELNLVDRRIVHGKLRLQELTAEVQTQDKKIEALRGQARGLEEDIKQKLLNADRLNMEIRAAGAETAEQEKKLKNIKNQREFRIVNDRIKDLKIRVDENESQVLSDMEEIEKLREKIAKCYEEIGNEELRLTTIRQKAHEEAVTIREKHAALLEERKAAVAGVEDIDPSAYQAYDLALKRTKGDPLAEMSADGICQSCFRRLNTNVINIVTIGHDVKNCRCQGCGRILYVKEQPAEA